MIKHVEQVKHNENFHFSLCSNFGEHYFDWKITCLFYTSYHLVQALSSHRGIVIGDRHSTILWNLNPKNRTRNMQIKNKAFDAYDQLFEYSQTARYSGFTDFATFQELKKRDYGDALKLYDYFRAYIIGNGIII